MITSIRMLLLALAIAASASTQEVFTVNTVHVRALIEAFQSGDADRIADRISYPLRRPYPLPLIRNKSDLKARFSQVFDRALLTRIATSQVADWTQAGWRGTMLGNGVVWLGEEDRRIVAINQSSPAEAQLRTELIEAARRALHPSVHAFIKPVLEWRTRHYHLRVDDCGNEDYRYAVWKSGQDTKEPPDLVLHGKIDIQGSIGNVSYHFANGEYRYVCEPVQGGSGEVAGSHLYVYHQQEQILDEVVMEDWADH